MKDTKGMQKQLINDYGIVVGKLPCGKKIKGQ
jgi:hypothetical protein